MCMDSFVGYLFRICQFLANFYEAFRINNWTRVRERSKEKNMEAGAVQRLQAATQKDTHRNVYARDAFEKFPRQEYRILSIIHNVWNSVYLWLQQKKRVANKNNEILSTAIQKITMKGERQRAHEKKRKSAEKKILCCAHSIQEHNAQVAMMTNTKSA